MGVTDGFHYITQEGDTFDMLALDAYNDEFRAGEIIRANPQYAGVVIFNAGVTLRIPYLKTAAPETLPPWKR
ncbi:MAG: tail protein X [Oscillospiraceae bacterium]|jgi:phage tail protein X|nr:tail protein X [Oscillospiraceae bacterium]